MKTGGGPGGGGGGGQEGALGRAKRGGAMGPWTVEQGKCQIETTQFSCGYHISPAGGVRHKKCLHAALWLFCPAHMEMRKKLCCQVPRDN